MLSPNKTAIRTCKMRNRKECGVVSSRILNTMEFFVERDRSQSVSSGGLFSGFKTSEMMRLSSLLDTRGPCLSITAPVNTFKTRSVSPSFCAVSLVELGSSFSQVFNSVVETVAVYVINFANRPPSINMEPS